MAARLGLAEADGSPTRAGAATTAAAGVGAQSGFDPRWLETPSHWRGADLARTPCRWHLREFVAHSHRTLQQYIDDGELEEAQIWLHNLHEEMDVAKLAVEEPLKKARLILPPEHPHAYGNGVFSQPVEPTPALPAANFLRLSPSPRSSPASAASSASSARQSPSNTLSWRSSSSESTSSEIDYEFD